MRIQRSVPFIARQIIKVLFRKTTLATLGVALIIGGSLVGQNILTKPHTSYAATPPDSCFAFSTGAITDYYDNEGNNGANPACPRAVDIPATIGGVAVTSLGQFAFHNKQLTSVTIPSSVTSIGDNAFLENQLTSVIIPSSVTSIGSAVFAYNQLTSVIIPSSVTNIRWGAFGNNQLTSVTIPNSVTSIEGYAFSSNKLTSVVIPSSVTSIGDNAFSDNQLASVTIPSNVTSIGSYTFFNNSLTSMTIPSNVTSIGDGAFINNNITSINFLGAPSSISRDILSENPIASITHNGTTYLINQPVLPIPTQCFSHTDGTITDYHYMDLEVLVSSGAACFSKAVDIPQSLDGVAITRIDYSAFNGRQLTAVTIPSSVTSIGDYAFASNQLAAVTIPNSVTTIGQNAFYGNNITNLVIPGTVTSIGPFAFEGNQLASLALSCGITSIGRELFAMNKLTEVTIPDCITSIDPTAFFGQNPWGGIIDRGTDPAHDWYSSDLGVKQLVYDNIWYARLYTSSPSNPNHLSDGVIDEYWYTGDLNNDGNATDSLGGHLINPASVTAHYVSGAGTSLAPSFQSTGRLADGTNLTDYLVKNVQTPGFVDAEYPTTDEQAALETALSPYYRVGQSVPLTAPTIAGYTLQYPSSPYTANLIGNTTTVNFTYSTPQTNTSSPTPNPSVGSAPSEPATQSKPITQPTTTDENTNNPTPTADPARTKVNFTAPEGSTTNPTTGSVPSGLTSIIAKSSLAVDETKPCHQIDSAKLLSATSFTTPDTKYKTLGGLAFVLNCATVGGDAAITFTLGDTIPDLAKIKIYKQDAHGVKTDITSQVSFSDQGAHTAIRYAVQDGKSLDDDGTANGSITDPIYITVPNDTAISVKSSTTDKQISWATVVLIASGAVVVLIITVAVNKNRHNSQ